MLISDTLSAPFRICAYSPAAVHTPSRPSHDLSFYPLHAQMPSQPQTLSSATHLNQASQSARRVVPYNPPKLQKIKCQIQYNSTTLPIMMPANFKIATLFPEEAMRVRRVAEPLSVEEKEENVSVWTVLLVGLRVCGFGGGK
jgi:hypothetical protein